MPAPSQPTPTAGPSPVRLTTWKQIAQHFDRSVRTVQRWESDQGLPVHRLPTARGESVFATVAELDRWASSAAGIATTRGSDDQPDPPPNGVERECRAATAARADVVAGALRPGRDQASPLHRPGARYASLVGLALLVMVVGWWFWGSLWSSPARPSGFRVEQDTLIVLDGGGSTLWTTTLPFRVAPQSEYDRAEREHLRPASVFADLDRDGQREVVFAARSPTGEGQVSCFAYDGAQRWDRRPDAIAHFGQGPMGPPWYPAFIVETRGPGNRPEIWAVWTHRPMFASFVERLDAESGKPLETYWSAGHISAVAATRIGKQDLLIIGAANNEFDAASLAVFDRSAAAGAAPAENSDYRCANCERGKLLAYFVLPKSSLAAQTRGLDGELTIQRIDVDTGGRIFATVQQLEPVGEVLYEIGADWKVVRAEILPSYRSRHDELFRLELVARPFSLEESNLELWPVRSWVGNGYVRINGPQGR